MADHPLLIFPRPERLEREKRKFPPKTISYPNINRQDQRLSPKLAELQRVFNEQYTNIQQSAEGIDPEQVLVFETIGTIDNFVSAVKKVDGMEWLGEIEIDSIQPDQDFYQIDNPQNLLSGRLFLIMSNQRALSELISLWNRYKNNPKVQFERGFTKFKYVFQQLKDIRRWGVQDRLLESNTIGYWIKSLNENPDKINIEIQLWYSSSPLKRERTEANIRLLISNLNGQIISSCHISEISYHSLLVQLPANEIRTIIETHDTELVRCDNIMFFRPSGQIVIEENGDTNNFEQVQREQPLPSLAEPVIALLDGMPMSNHTLLDDRLIIDDPDSFQDDYESQYRLHGTAMSSLIIHGDLNNLESPLNTPLYVRPIMKLKDYFNKKVENVPDDVLIVDLIHRAVKRIFEGESDAKALKSIKVINFSIGDPACLFYGSISPLAKLLDWLSYKYGVLFIISTGNHIEPLELEELYRDFKVLSSDEKEKRIYKKIISDIRNRKLLSPSESINNLSIGSAHFDISPLQPYDRRLNPTLKLLPSLFSGFGNGYRNSIKPDAVFYGGRIFIKEPMLDNNPTPIEFSFLNTPPGQKVAAPSPERDKVNFTRGTSNATALMSRNAASIIDVLYNINDGLLQSHQYSRYIPIMIKSMLIHGCSWDNIGENLRNMLNDIYSNTEIKKIITKWIGYGLPDINKVKQCTEQRATVIGFGELMPDEVHLFKLPLPQSLSSKMENRRLTITLAWFSPIKSTTQKYRVASLYFEATNEIIGVSRDNADWHAVRKGTIQHEVFVGSQAMPFADDDSLNIKVICKNDADVIKLPIQYSLVVTLEVAENINIPVYQEIKNKISIPVSISI